MVILSLISIAMMIIDHRQHSANAFRSVLSVVVYPIQYVVGLPERSYQWLAEALTTRHRLEQENSELHAQQILLKAQLLRLAALEAENNRLRELLDSSAKLNQHVVSAEILSVDLAPFSRQVVLNRGGLDQVTEGQPILDADGVMGQVIKVTPLSSTVMLITDPNHAIPVEVNRNGLRAIAYGTGNSNRVELSSLPFNADIQPGDLLVTSGLGGRFPAGYPVARVTTVDRGSENHFARVSAEPTAHIENSRLVLLVSPVADPAASSQAARAAAAEPRSAEAH
jgi:rod shape-determining protein MreC